MFGLENQKKKKPQTEMFVFELEKDLKDFAKNAEIGKRIENRLGVIKKILQQGEAKEEFDRLGALLHGYASLLKVMSRFKPDKK